MSTFESQSKAIDNLLFTTASQLSSYRSFLNLYEAELSPSFNSFNFIQPNEPKLSDIIADLLDPKGSHGQGAVFLHLFLDIDKILAALKGQFEIVSDVSVRRERATDENRFIDIVVCKPGVFGIGVENKPWAEDRYQQISDYIKFLKKEFVDNFLCIYLSRDGAPPSEESIATTEREDYERKKQFLTLSYSVLRKWLSICCNHCQSERVRAFLKDFELYLHHNFEGGTTMTESKLICENILSSDANLDAALLVAGSIDEVKDRLIGKLKDQIEKDKNIGQSGLSLEWSPDQGSRFSGFSFAKKDWKRYTIAFEWGYTEYQNFSYGIAKRNEQESDIPSLGEYFKKFGKGDISSWWPWAINFDEPYFDWNISARPWIDIKNGELAEKVIKLTLDMLKQLEECAKKEKIDL